MEAHAVFSNASCVNQILSCLDHERDLASALQTCVQWNHVAQSDAIWQSVYLHRYGYPAPEEKTTSFLDQTKRLYGLRKLEHGAVEDLPWQAEAVLYDGGSGKYVFSVSNPPRLLLFNPSLVGCQQVELGETSSPPDHRTLLASNSQGLLLVLVSGSMIKVVDVRSQPPSFHSFPLFAHQHPVMALVADGDIVATACSNDLNIWSLHDMKRLQCLHTRPLRHPLIEGLAMALSSNHQLLAVINHSLTSPSVLVMSTAHDNMAEVVEQLPVNAPQAVKFHRDHLLVISHFGSVNRRRGSEGEVLTSQVLSMWNTRTWQCTRRVGRSPLPLPYPSGMSQFPCYADWLYCTGDLVMFPLVDIVKAWTLPSPGEEKGTSPEVDPLKVVRMSAVPPPQGPAHDADTTPVSDAMATGDELHKVNNIPGPGDSCSSNEAGSSAGARPTYPEAHALSHPGATPSGKFLLLPHAQAGDPLYIIGRFPWRVRAMAASPYDLVYVFDTGHVARVRIPGVVAPQG